MLLADVVATSTEVAATRSRKAKTAAFAELFARVAASSADEIETVTSYLGRVAAAAAHRAGLAVDAVAAGAGRRQPSLTVLEVHEAFERIAALSGLGVPGGACGRRRRSCSGGRRPRSSRGCAGS